MKYQFTHITNHKNVQRVQTENTSQNINHFGNPIHFKYFIIILAFNEKYVELQAEKKETRKTFFFEW